MGVSAEMSSTYQIAKWLNEMIPKYGETCSGGIVQKLKNIRLDPSVDRGTQGKRNPGVFNVSTLV